MPPLVLAAIRLKGRDQGRSTSASLAGIVRAWQPNALSFAGRAGIYASRWGEFLLDDPREANSAGGVFPAIWGTVAMTLIMALLVAPFGVLAALYLREYATRGPLTSAVRIAINNLAGVPSIVYGAFGFAVMIVLYRYLSGGMVAATVAAIVMLIVGFCFATVSGYLVGVIGSSNNPISGLTLSTLIVAALLMVALGMQGPQGVAVVLGVAAVVCVSAAVAGELLQDFKAGYILGGTPRTITSNAPPIVSPASRARSIAEATDPLACSVRSASSQLDSRRMAVGVRRVTP